MQRHLATSHSPPHTDTHSPLSCSCVDARLVSSVIRRHAISLLLQPGTPWNWSGRSDPLNDASFSRRITGH